MCGIAHRGGSTRALCWRPDSSAPQDAKAWLAYCTGSGLVALQSFAPGDENDSTSGVLVAEGERVRGVHRIDMVHGGDGIPAHSSYLRDVLGDFATSVSWCNESTNGDEMLAVGTSRGSVVLFSLVHETDEHVSLEPMCRLVCSTSSSTVMYASFISTFAVSPAELPKGCRDVLMVATGKGVSAWDVYGSRRVVWSKELKTNRAALCGLMCSMQHMPFFVMGMDTGDVEILSPGVISFVVSSSKAPNRLPNTSSVYGIDVDARGRRLVYATSSGDIEVVDVSECSIMQHGKRPLLMWNDESLAPEVVASCGLSLCGEGALEPDVRLSRPMVDGDAPTHDDDQRRTSPDALAAMNCVKWVPAEDGEDGEERLLAAGGALGLIRILPAKASVPTKTTTAATKRKNKNKTSSISSASTTRKKMKKI